MTDVTMRQLLELGVHFGHQTRFWCPKMSPYIFGHRNKIHIINLERTLAMFNEALGYLSGIASKRGTVMFVGTKRQAGKIVLEQALRAECPYVYHRWLGGMLTNHRTVKKSIDRLNELNEIIESDGIKKLVKKEALRIERERFRLDRNLAGIMNMRGLPDALFVIDVKHENIAIKEANKLGIPVVAVVDTNCDPDGIDYIIPGNDDAVSAIRLYCSAAADAIIEGKAKASAEEPTFSADSPEPIVSAEEVSTYQITGARAAVAPLIGPAKPEEQEKGTDPIAAVETESADASAHVEAVSETEESALNESEAVDETASVEPMVEEESESKQDTIAEEVGDAEAETSEETDPPETESTPQVGTGTEEAQAAEETHESPDTPESEAASAESKEAPDETDKSAKASESDSSN